MNNKINAVFHHLALNVNDYDQTVEFYDKIGFTRQLEWFENGLKVCFLNTGNGLFLELHEIAEDQINSRVPHICIYVDNIEAFYTLALEYGAETVISPSDSPPLKLLNGKMIFTHTCWVRSPNGEIIEAIIWKDYDAVNYNTFTGSQN